MTTTTTKTQFVALPYAPLRSSPAPLRWTARALCQKGLTCALREAAEEARAEQKRAEKQCKNKLEAEKQRAEVRVRESCRRPFFFFFTLPLLLPPFSLLFSLSDLLLVLREQGAPGISLSFLQLAAFPFD